MATASFKLRIALAQINCTVGDLGANHKKISEYTHKARQSGADIVCFPELALTGYPPEDLLLKPKFIKDNLKELKKLAKTIHDIVAVVGFVDEINGDLFNAAAVIYQGTLRGVAQKMFLPNYGVFDEKRYFKASPKPAIFSLGRCVFGINICEDIWHKGGPAHTQAQWGARLILNINSSPYHAGKVKQRKQVIIDQAKRSRIFIVYTNLVGGQDELVFDGQSMIVDDKGNILAQAQAFKEDLLIADVEIPPSRVRPGGKVIIIDGKRRAIFKPQMLPQYVLPLEQNQEIYSALMLGLRDYVLKNGFRKVVIGISGGIDSAVVATIAADALGKENVTGIFMPSRYSSQESEEDAKILANNLGIKLINIPIEQVYKTYLAVVEPHFSGLESNITEENIQARIRGNLLMAFSNKFGWLVLTTGNKSEMSTGYATLYGDMAGGLALIKDVPKTLVYKLVEHRNSLSRVIPERIITKEPSAELRPNQKDRDTLPPYEILDPILKLYIEEDMSLDEIVREGFDKETVAKVISLVDKSEYKRRQAPPGIKITPKAFGRDRRMPITNEYNGQRI